MKQLPQIQLLHYCWTLSPMHLKLDCAHHTITSTSLWQRAPNNHHHFLQRQKVMEKHCLNMTGPVLCLIKMGGSFNNTLKILSKQRSAFFCSVIKWRSTPNTCWLYIKLGLHAGGCLGLQPEKQRQLRFCSTGHPGWWSSSVLIFQLSAFI